MSYRQGVRALPCIMWADNDKNGTGREAHRVKRLILYLPIATRTRFAHPLNND